MHINKIRLTDFKRFSDLTIDLSAVQPPKLVLLIGANGSGKSSIFDAFNWIAAYKKMILAPVGLWLEIVPIDEPPPVRENSLKTYFGKARKEPKISISFDENLLIENFWDFENNIVFEGIEKTSSNLFYGRSALRQAPRLNKNPSGSTTVLDDSDRPAFYIDAENRLGNDVSILLKSGWDLEKSFALPLNNAFKNIFGEDKSISLKIVEVTSKPPIQIIFEKGQSTFDYDLLSSGEKEVFGILLNLLVRRESFQNTIYFIDELDVHLNTSLQHALLKEITENWIPEGCQLWTATHSLGFIQYAKETENAVILDFDHLNFDTPQTIVPQLKENLEVYDIAVPKDMLSKIFLDKSLTFCENTDVVIYNSISFSEKVFLPAKDKNDVYFLAKNNPEFFGVMDKDFLTPQEIELIREKVSNLFVLNYYSIESYLYHPENLAEVISDFNIEDYREDLKQQKQSNYERVLYGVKQARDSYKVLTIESIKLNGIEEHIFASLRSDSFEDFYPYLDMKKLFRHGHHNIPKIRLAQTEWVTNALSQIINAN